MSSGKNSVGAISLDLNLNQRDFQRQMNGITSMAKKAGVAIAGAFAAKKLVDFGRKAVDLGSDLAEVQNVVDVTFSRMSAQVNDFARNAATSFGLSETMAKKYVGTFGAMSKAFGFSEKQAYDMSTALTGLAGDVASFYNLSQDEAYTKLKSVFTGETETLKDLGVVMTQNALDAYAMANGYGKVTAKMSEAEKVALRFAFVQDQLSLANGDFARTADGWANQVRILKLQMESFMATVGQGFINIFTPVIKVINTLMGKLIQLAEVFKRFTEAFSGKKSSADNAANSAASAVSGVGAAAKKTASEAKKASKSLAGFDTLNVLDDKKAGSGDSGAGAAFADSPIEMPDINAAEEVDRVQSSLQRFVDWYNANFEPVFAEASRKVSPQLDKIRDTFSRVVSDIQALGEPLKTWFLNDFTTFLQQTVTTSGDILAELLDTFNTTFSAIWDLAVYPMLSKFVDTGLPILTQFFTECVSTAGVMFNQLKQIFDTLWGDVVNPVLSLVSKIWQDVWSAIDAAWVAHGAAIFDAIREAINKTGDTLSNIWSTVLKPTFDALMDMLNWLWDSHLEPLLRNALDFIGELITCILRLYNDAIVPLVDLLLDALGPALSGIGSIMIDLTGTILGTLTDVLNGITTISKGIIEFLTGVFTADFRKAFDGIGDILKGVEQMFGGIAKGIVNTLIDMINAVISYVTNGINWIVDKVNSVKINVPDWIPGIGGKSFAPNLKRIEAYQIPKLATGAVIPPNREFAAVLGDQKSGTNIEAPLKTIEQALRNVLSEKGRANGGNVTVVLEIDGREFARGSAPYVAGENSRRGVRLINGVT